MGIRAVTLLSRKAPTDDQKADAHLVFMLISSGWLRTFLLLLYDPEKGFLKEVGFRIRNHRIKSTELQILKILKIRIRFK